jgi:hypothetical protein
MKLKELLGFVVNNGKYKDKKYHANINPTADPESKIERWWGIFE